MEAFVIWRDATNYTKCNMSALAGLKVADLEEKRQ